MFVGNLAPEMLEDFGVYLYTEGVTDAVAIPGDPVPGGGHFVTTSPFARTQDLNDRGDVVFNARLDTDRYFDDEGARDTGAFVWSRGSLHLVARTGTVIPDIGTIAHVNAVDLSSIPEDFLMQGFTTMNNRGQVAFQATLTDGRGVILMATPKGGGR